MKWHVATVGALTFGALFSPSNLQAQSWTFLTEDAGFYWRAAAGANVPEDGHITEFGGLSTGQTVKYDVGASLDLAGGYAFNKYVAAELQVGGTWNSIDSIEGASTDDTYFGIAPILANVVLQCPIPQTVIVPYLGAGVGGAATMFDTDGLMRPTPGGAVTLEGADSDFVFAWQGFAGVRFALNESISIGLEYRYLHVDGSTFRFNSWHYGEPDLDFGLSSHQSHTAAITFQMKF